MELSSISNPHATFTYHAPDGEVEVYARSVHTCLPRRAQEIKPRPYLASSSA